MLPLLITTLTTNLNLGEEIVSSTATTTGAAANALSGLNDLVTGFNWQSPSWDFFIILFFILSAVIYGLSLGRQRVIVILVSIYMSLAVADYAPLVEGFIKDKGLSGYFPLQAAAFLGAFLILFFSLSRSALLKVFGGGNHESSWWQTMLFSILQIGLLISVTLNFLPVSVTDNLSAFTHKIFINETARFIWILAPILAMIFIRGPKRRRSLSQFDDEF